MLPDGPRFCPLSDSSSSVRFFGRFYLLWKHHFSVSRLLEMLHGKYYTSNSYQSIAPRSGSTICCPRYLQCLSDGETAPIFHIALHTISKSTRCRSYCVRAIQMNGSPPPNKYHNPLH